MKARRKLGADNFADDFKIGLAKKELALVSVMAPRGGVHPVFKCLCRVDQEENAAVHWSQVDFIPTKLICSSL